MCIRSRPVLNSRSCERSRERYRTCPLRATRQHQVSSHNVAQTHSRRAPGCAVLRIPPVHAQDVLSCSSLPTCSCRRHRSSPPQPQGATCHSEPAAVRLLQPMSMLRYSVVQPLRHGISRHLLLAACKSSTVHASDVCPTYELRFDVQPAGTHGRVPHTQARQARQKLLTQERAIGGAHMTGAAPVAESRRYEGRRA